MASPSSRQTRPELHPGPGSGGGGAPSPVYRGGVDRFTQVTVFLVILTLALSAANVVAVWRGFEGEVVSPQGITAYWAAVTVYVSKALDRRD